MKLFATLILSLYLSSPSLAAEQRNWVMSSTELMFNLSANESSQDLHTDPQLLNAQAQGYIMAIMDDKNWCFKSKISPHDVYDRVFSYLNSLDENTLETNASILVAQALHTYCKY